MSYFIVPVLRRRKTKQLRRMPRTKIYVAGPLFSRHEREFLEKLVETIATGLGLDQKANFFLPHRDAGRIGVSREDRNGVFEIDIDQLSKCDVIVALLDGPDVDSGTAAELGFAYANGKEVFGILTDWRCWNGRSLGRINNMVWGICGKGDKIFKDIDESFLMQLRKAIEP
jgi:nucleoside 2-deoxyribosyltransferase